MAIDLDSGAGLFDRLGVLGGALTDVNTFVGGTSAGQLVRSITDVLAKYTAGSAAIQGAVDHLLGRLEAGELALDDFKSALREAASNTLVEMADADNPLVERSVIEALKELALQMVAGAETVDASEPSIASAAGGSNTGNGAVVMSVKNGRGQRLENVLAEDLNALCTEADTSGQEVFRVRGEDAFTTDKLHFAWPQGSGSDLDYTAVDAAVDDLTTNGDFESFTVADTPDDWAIVVGAAGADVLQGATVYKGSKSLKFAGDGATLTQVRQTLDVDALTSRTPYAVNFWARVSAAPAAGVLTVDLYNGSAVINDDEGTANSFTVDLTTLGTTFVAKNGVFRLPDPLPAAVYLRLRLSTALSNTKNLFMDHLALAEMQKQYGGPESGGPYLAFFSGATDWALDDVFTVTVTNAYAGAFQQLFDKLFEQDYLLPSATGAAETISDALIA